MTTLRPSTLRYPRGLVLLALVSGCDPAHAKLDRVQGDAPDDLPADLPLAPEDLPGEDEPELEVADEQEREPGDPTASPGLTSGSGPVLIADETSSAYLGVRRVTDYYLNPLYAETSYAAVSIPGCSATMIGPNILATAAHCGVDGMLTMTAQGRVYRDRDLNQPQVEGYECNLLFHTFPETDLAIYHCPPPAFGPSLGDRFGWVDVALTEPTLYSYLFSVFSNPIDDQNPGVHSLLTSGYVSQTNLTNHWANPNDPPGVDATPQLHEAMWTELWSNFGSSGSGQFNSAGQMSIGPQSTGIADSLGRGALSMRDYLMHGWIYAPQSAACADPNDPDNCSTDETVNGTYVAGLGLDPDDYRDTYADLDLDGFFDLVSDVEDLDGEGYKTLYHQSFGSRRQARQWTMGPGSTHELNAARVSFATNMGSLRNAWIEVGRHSNLNLSPNQDYEVSFGLDSSTGYYQVCLDGNTTTCSSYFLDASDDGETAHRVSLVSPAGDPELVIRAWNGVGTLHDVSLTTSVLYGYAYTPQGWVARVQHINDFDRFDAREAWDNPDNAARPSILPDGDDAGVDWAARLSTVSSGAAGFDYDLETTTLPFPEGGDGTLCFEHRRDDSVAWEGATLGRVRVERFDGTSVDGTYFIPTEDWGQACFVVEASVANGEALRVKFGFYTTGSGTRRGAYFVDDVAVRLPTD